MNPVSASLPAIKRSQNSNPRESFFAGRTQIIGNSSSIGAILVNAGRLSEENVTRILEAQVQQQNHFGEAAICLGLLTEDDVRFALSRQFNNLYLPAGDNSLSHHLIAAYKPFSPVVEHLRSLRSQLMLRWFEPDTDRNVLAIVSPGLGEGRSFIAANLAIVFSQLGKSTLLIDANLRAPRQQEFFKVNTGGGLSSYLAGRAGLESIVRIPSLLGLSVLPAGAVPPNPQELIGRSVFADLLQSVGCEFDIVIVDTPSASEYAEAQIIATEASAALIVLRKNHTSLSRTMELARRFQQTGAAVVGSVLNDF
ncbi:chain length determinant protein tyrosine kinase EpsG [Nitrosospira multiformis]|uniref:Chain length determinant protein tyrosine kinase EpsG n=1 Tax=Nitrosospira multiformis TaxID=1231 RepID=A0A1I0A211_9PROT|nr:chain length determinant protein tyrosine kinase EpsG [Nitrosospira multiformis]SES88178.1 chain length determinant protein tyrosine kinase EpsG [Nitrosospira multiformis]